MREGTTRLRSKEVSNDRHKGSRDDEVARTNKKEDDRSRILPSRRAPSRERSPRRRSRERGGGRREYRNERMVYISNIPYDVRWMELKDLIRSKGGEVNFVEILEDRNGKSKGAAVVEFREKESVEQCVTALHRFEIKDRLLTAKEIRDPIAFFRKVKEDTGVDFLNGLHQRSGSGMRHMPEESFRSNVPFDTFGLSPNFLRSLSIEGPLTNRIFVSNLPYNVQSGRVNDIFSLAGKVTWVDVQLDKEGRSKGMAVIQYSHPIEAVQAISMLNNQRVFDRVINVKMDKFEHLDERGDGELPLGLRGVGMGLGANGAPLGDVTSIISSLNSTGHTGAVSLMSGIPEMSGMSRMSGMDMMVGPSDFDRAQPMGMGGGGGPAVPYQPANAYPHQSTTGIPPLMPFTSSSSQSLYGSAPFGAYGGGGGGSQPYGAGAGDQLGPVGSALGNPLLHSILIKNQFPADNAFCSNAQNFSNAIMRPFKLINSRGLSNAYTDNMYTYAARPTCSSNRDCNSAYLFCSRRRGDPHCVSKIKVHGSCQGFEGENPCYQGTCTDGHCRPTAAVTKEKITTTPPSTPLPTTTTPLPSSIPMAQSADDGFVSVIKGKLKGKSITMVPPATNTTRNSDSIDNGCFNDDPCCSLWAENGECPHNVGYMSRYCKRSCGYCKSNDNRKGCFDRHISCSYWRSKGECSKRRQWMSENCRESCGWCGVPTIALCNGVARLSRM